MLGKLRKLNHPFCMERLKKDFFKQTVGYWGDGYSRQQEHRGIERLCHFGVAKYLSVPGAYGVCGFAISLGEVGEEGMDRKRWGWKDWNRVERAGL